MKSMSDPNPDISASTANDAAPIAPEAATPEAVTKSSRAAQGIIFLTICIDLLGFAIVLPLLPRYGEYYQAQPWMLGLLMASFSAMQFLFSPFWGRLSDMIGRRPVLIIGLMSSTISYLAFGWISNFKADQLILGLSPLAWLFITRIGAGIAGATITTAQAYIADTTTLKNRGKGMALVGAAFGVGFTFGPLIGAAFVGNDLHAQPSSSPGYAAGILSGIACILAMIYLPESRKPGTVNPNGEAVPSTAHRQIFDVKAFKAALARPSIGILLLTIFMATFAFAQFETTLSLLTESMGIGQRWNFYLFAYIGFILVLGQGFFVRRMLPKYGEYKMGIIGVVLMIVGLGGIAAVSQQKSIGLLYLVLPLSVLGFCCLNPSLQSLLSRRTSENDQGGVLGLGQSMSALARIAGPVVGLSLFSNDHPWVPYVFGAVFIALTLLLFPKLKGNESV
jgi:MFS family permease